MLSESSLREMTRFRGEWYGLGALDFANPDNAGYPEPSVGHGGSEESHFVRLVAFTTNDVVVSVQANTDAFEQIEPLTLALSTAAVG